MEGRNLHYAKMITDVVGACYGALRVTMETGEQGAGDQQGLG